MIAKPGGWKPPPLTKEEEEKSFEFRRILDLFVGTEGEWEGRGCPEFVYMRDICFLVKLSMEPMEGLLGCNGYLRGRELGVGSFVGKWHHQDATPNVAKVGVHIANQPKLRISNEHPKSPTEPDRFVPPTISGIPQTPHLLAMLMTGYKPSSAEITSSRSKPNTLTVSEEDVQGMSSIPTFSGCLTPTEVVELASLLTVPYSNIPLILSFFTTSIGSLLHPDLQHILESVLFEPRSYNPQPQPITVAPIPVDLRERQLGTTRGVLSQELRVAPETTLKPLLELLESGTRLCIGDHRSSFAILLLFLTRTAIRVGLYWVWERKKEGTFCSSSRIGQQFIEMISSSLLPKLNNLLSHALEKEDTASQVLIRSHLLLCREFLLSTSSSSIVDLLSESGRDTAYVISWHSKGMDGAQKLTETEVAPDSKVFF